MTFARLRWTLADARRVAERTVWILKPFYLFCVKKLVGVL